MFHCLDLNWCVRVYPSSDNICQLELRFDEFRVQQPDVYEECVYDYLEIVDNSNRSQSQRFCEPFTGIRVVNIESSRTFNFVSDNAISDVGFSIFVKQKPCDSTTTLTPIDGRTSMSTSTSGKIRSESSRHHL